MTGPGKAYILAGSALSSLSITASLALLFLFLLLFALITAFGKAARHLSFSKLEEEARAGDRRAAALAGQMTGRGLEGQLDMAQVLFGSFFFFWGAADSLPKVLALTAMAEGAGTAWAKAGLFVLLLLLFLLVGYEIPRRLAGGKEGAFAKKTWWIMAPILTLARLFMGLAGLVSRILFKILRVHEIAEPDLAPTEEEFLQMLEAGHARGAIEDDNRDLIANLFEFDDKIASEVMTHRTEIEAIPVEAGLDETMQFLHNTRYTRFPVYRGTVDNIIGLLHAKDLLFYLEKGGGKEAFSLADIMRPAWFTPETRNISDLFRDMQQSHIQMAIVIDEYGGTAGLLTIEDLVEQILGNIEDEYDEVSQEIMEIAPDTWLVDGSFPADRLARVTGVAIEGDDYDTVAGLVIELLDRIPEEEERPVVRYGPLAFQVLAVSDKRVARVRVSRTDKGEEEENGGD